MERAGLPFAKCIRGCQQAARPLHDLHGSWYIRKGDERPLFTCQRNLSKRLGNASEKSPFEKSATFLRNLFLFSYDTLKICKWRCSPQVNTLRSFSFRTSCRSIENTLCTLHTRLRYYNLDTGLMTRMVNDKIRVSIESLSCWRPVTPSSSLFRGGNFNFTVGEHELCYPAGNRRHTRTRSFVYRRPIKICQFCRLHFGKPNGSLQLPLTDWTRYGAIRQSQWTGTCISGDWTKINYNRIFFLIHWFIDEANCILKWLNSKWRSITERIEARVRKGQYNCELVLENEAAWFPFFF